LLIQNWRLSQEKDLNSQGQILSRVYRFIGNLYINVKMNQPQTFLPEEATFVWVQCKFKFGRKQPQKMDGQGTKKQQKMSSQRIFRVPNSQ
jgi:hypothetical protein